MKKLILCAALALGLCLSAGAYAEEPLIVVTAVGADQDILEVARQVAEKDGLKVEIVGVEGYVLPNMAVADKDADLNSFQHQPYLDSFNKERGLNLVSVGKTYIAPMAIFSKKIKSLDELKEGDSVAVPNDPTNEGRALLLLQAAGKIKLKEGADLTATKYDIAENPLKLEILEVDAAQTPRSLDDATIAAINNTFVAPSGLKFDDAIYKEDRNSPYVNVIVSRDDTKGDPRYAQFVKAYQSKEVADFIMKRFEGNTFPAFDY